MNSTKISHDLISLQRYENRNLVDYHGKIFKNVKSVKIKGVRNKLIFLGTRDTKDNSVFFYSRGIKLNLLI